MRTESFPTEYRTTDTFDTHDFDIVRLSLTDDNILEWSRLNLDETTARDFCRNHGLDLTLDSDVALVERIRDEAVAYLKEEFGFPTPSPIRQADLVTLLVTASSSRNRHRQFCACTLLKAMHAINHFDATEARLALKSSDQTLFHKAEARIYRCISMMMAQQLPVVEFAGGRKRRESMITKLLSKNDPLAAQVFDKIRFRIVTPGQDDILPVIAFLSKNLFPFNYILSGESYNSLLPFAEQVQRSPHLRKLAERTAGLDAVIGKARMAGDEGNRYSSPNYRVIHWVADMPVRVDDYENAFSTDGINPVPRPILYVRTEIQILDQQSHLLNERGEAAHTRYKARQKRSVMQRLRVGNPT